MHPELRLRSLDVLPFSLRRLAEAACKADADIATIDRVLNLVGTEGWTGKRSRILLPVCYAHLALDRLPTVDSEEHLGSVATRAYIATLALFRMQDIPLGVRCELWPLLWSWGTLLDAFWGLLPADIRMRWAWDVFYVYLLSFAVPIGDALDVFVESPGLRGLVGRVWATLPRQIQAEVRVVGINTVHALLFKARAWEYPNLRELLDGFDNPLKTLAQLLLYTLSHVAAEMENPTPTSLIAPSSLQIINCLSSLDLIGCNVEPTDGSRPYLHLLQLLASKRINILPTLTKLFRLTLEFPDPFKLMQSVLGAMYRIFTVVPDVRHGVASALDANLFYSLVDAYLVPGIDAPENEAVLDVHSGIFNTVLVQELIHFRVGKALLNSILRRDTKLKPPKEQTGLVGAGSSAREEVYVPLMAQFEMGSALLEALDAKLIALGVACDRPECTRVVARRVMRRCSACRILHYCCQTCQRLDWAEHRQVCQFYARSALFPESKLYRYSLKERQYFSVTLREEFLRSFRWVLEQHSLALSQLHPATPPLLTLLDTTDRTQIRPATGKPSTIPRTKFGVASAVDSPLALQLRAAEPEVWGDLLRRVRRSAGRTNLCLIRVRRPPTSVDLVILVRSEANPGWSLCAAAQRVAEKRVKLRIPEAIGCLGSEEAARIVKEVESALEGAVDREMLELDIAGARGPGTVRLDVEMAFNLLQPPSAGESGVEATGADA
ncbi:Ankyrin repeat-containing protein [Mycena kentingensis (nom. inval.)]|nr:Ankyrin repeat-containing protein [Mycena kentingensis (nom. inval.)]